ncbi:MAG: Calx-beta domain-containing protein, partial [Prochlorococcaceae cyanobacterium]
GSFTLRLSEVTTVPVTVTYSFRDGEALSPSDYTPVGGTTGTLTFEPGIAARTIVFEVSGDGALEPTEQFYLDLTEISNATFSNGASILTATATIEDGSAGIRDDITETNNSGNRKGTSFDDVLWGDDGVNVIEGGDGNDTITGFGGADVLSGGQGADTFRYLNFADSNLAAMDRIVDFNAAEGDRIAAATMPSALWNVGVVEAGSLQLALESAFRDKDLLSQGDQALAAGEAVTIVWGSTIRGRRTYMAIADADSTSLTDALVIQLPNGSQPIGALAPSSLFTPLA